MMPPEAYDYVDRCWENRRSSLAAEYANKIRETQLSLSRAGYGFEHARFHVATTQLEVEGGVAIVRARVECWMTAIKMLALEITDELITGILADCAKIASDVASTARISRDPTKNDLTGAAVAQGIRDGARAMAQSFCSDLQVRVAERNLRLAGESRDTLRLQQLANEKLILVKQDGTRIEFKGLAQNGSVVTFDSRLKAEDGDKIERKLPSGAIELYVIEDLGYNAAFRRIPEHYQMKVRKASEEVQRGGASNVSITYNLQGPNARINVNSTDNSHNVANIGETELFQKLREAIQKGVPDQGQSAVLLGTVDELEQSKGTPGYAERFQRFISNAANCMTLITPFLPALTQMLLPK